MSLIRKRNNIRILIDRARFSARKGYYLESIWIYYAIIDSRITKALESLGEPIKNPDGSHLPLGEKLDSVKALFDASNPLLVQAGFDKLDYTSLSHWIRDRNSLTHGLWNRDREWKKYQKYLRHLSDTGESFMLSWAAALQRLKKRKKKLRIKP